MRCCAPIPCIEKMNVNILINVFLNLLFFLKICHQNYLTVSGWEECVVHVQYILCKSYPFRNLARSFSLFFLISSNSALTRSASMEISLELFCDAIADGTDLDALV